MGQTSHDRSNVNLSLALSIFKCIFKTNVVERFNLCLILLLCQIRIDVVGRCIPTYLPTHLPMCRIRKQQVQTYHACVGSRYIRNTLSKAKHIFCQTTTAYIFVSEFFFMVILMCIDYVFVLVYHVFLFVDILLRFSLLRRNITLLGTKPWLPFGE